jgi:hypothetical protein
VDANLTQKGELVYRSDRKSPEESDPVEVNFLAVQAEPKRFALVSSDGQFRAFGEVIPFPIEARDGACKVSVIMLAPLYALVSVHAEGLRPNENFQVRMQSGREVGQPKPKVDENGRWSVDGWSVRERKEGRFHGTGADGCGMQAQNSVPLGSTRRMTRA